MHIDDLDRDVDAVCTCGVVITGTDVIGSRGHRDLRTWRAADSAAAARVRGSGVDADTRRAATRARASSTIFRTILQNS